MVHGEPSAAPPFGLGKIFGGGRMLKLKDVLSWMLYRTFNPFLYGGLFGLMIVAALVVPSSGK
jgi:hypothetical protein